MTSKRKYDEIKEENDRLMYIQKRKRGNVLFSKSIRSKNPHENLVPNRILNCRDYPTNFIPLKFTDSGKYLITMSKNKMAIVIFEYIGINKYDLEKQNIFEQVFKIYRGYALKQNQRFHEGFIHIYNDRYVEEIFRCYENNTNYHLHLIIHDIQEKKIKLLYYLFF